MNVLGLSVNHGTTAYVELMIKTLLDVDAGDLELLVLDNGSDDLGRLDCGVTFGGRLHRSAR